jgi:hypothetical protein
MREKVGHATTGASEIMTRENFGERFVAFVDVLGFTDIISRMSRQKELFNTVRDALKAIDRQAREFQQYRQNHRKKHEKMLRDNKVPLTPPTDLQMTAFSDCYVLSEIAPAWHVIAAVQALGARFLREGILTRGGVVWGKAYHSGRVLFGPGIIDAYQLEKEVAKYPRIIISEDVRQEVWGYHKGLWEGNLLKQDVDRCWFINLLTPSISSWGAIKRSSKIYDLREHLNKIRSALKHEWQRVQGDPARMSKVWWMIHQYNNIAPDAHLRMVLK